MTITTKFTVASEQGIRVLLQLTKELATEKFSALLTPQVLEKYIAVNFNPRALGDEVNSLSNQWIVAYADGQPAGYACVTSKGSKPEQLDSLRAIRIADFGVLSKYPDLDIPLVLLEKCLTVCRSYDAIWINEYAGNPFLALFESKGFIRQPEEAQLDNLPLSSVCLIA